MNTRLVSLCLAAMSIACAPAFASDDAATNTVLLPVRVLALGAGTVIGTPVSIIKKTISNVGKHTGVIADKLGGKDNALAVMLAFPPALVSGTAFGTAQGLCNGPKNALDNCSEHPFGAESMSLGEGK